MRELYFDADSVNTYLDVPEFAYPTEVDLLKIFPEAKEIIREKITECLQLKEELLAKEVMPILNKIDAIPDELSRFFWKEAYKVLINPEFVGALENLERLRRLHLLLCDNRYSRRIKDIERQKEIARQVPIQQFYAFQHLRRVGRRHIALCPFHNEKTASFVIYPDNTFHCFGCGAHGDSIEFVKRIKQCDFREAVGTMVGLSV